MTNTFCSGGAPSYRTEAFSVSLPFHESAFISGKYLSDALKKCANYLAVWKIRINTHTHTHTIFSPRVNIQIIS